MCFVTKATPISNTDSKCHIKKLKRSRTCLIGYSGFISCEWLFNSLGGGHTHFADKSISRNQACAWFKNTYLINSRWVYTLIAQTPSGAMQNYIKQVKNCVYQIYSVYYQPSHSILILQFQASLSFLWYA